MSNTDLHKDIEELKNKNDNLEKIIIERFDNLEKIIIERFDNLEKNNLNHVKESCNRMNNHIDFINETYSTLHSPLSYFKNSIESIMGYNSSETKSLPTIKDHEYDN